ncbi:unnamed protein product [Moneuplotes crassus]|uniref:PHR domain-containing protein n=1 Tax=Euplotes crassus TaxID=5936 RepID=A0AAD2CX60_EUPCR|nr:unnamed protein product [Moneuplotes crassus]
MESKKGIWLRTKDDGVLLFKNINLSQQESDKEEKKDPDAVEHSKETVIHEFEEDVQPFTHGSKYFHTEMQVFCTVTDRTEGEDGKLTSIKINMPTLQMEGVPVDIDENSEKILQSSMDIYLRGVQKSGSKFTVQGTYNLNRSLKENMALVFQSLGQNMGNFKLFHNQKILSLSEDFSEIYESGKDTYIYAFECLGKPRMFRRFPRCYEGGTWSCGGSADAIAFTPNKDITVAGFQFFCPKEDSQCEMKYKITIDDVVVEETEAQVYSDWEDTYYKSVFLEKNHPAKANSRINILIKIAKSLENSQYTNTYYGTEGNDVGNIENEDIGLFSISYGTDCCNGTSESSGQIPAIFYYLG